ncbi:Flp pilus assembly protein [Pandoraea terrae]|uniref:Flp pilus assembly protein n=1 Tax=Pandoraea terrae TaxID=1537710 RepID=A0A5E4Z6A5_9BURK|nr:pilus assembly protein [Pandoraea terrae]VVE56584.1 Flp pilus assembly protein [Pandoraea terrae]
MIGIPLTFMTRAAAARVGATAFRRGRPPFASMLVSTLVALLAACSSTQTGGYGAAPSAADLMRAEQEADAQARKPDSKDVYLSLIRQMQGQGMYFASLAHIDGYRQQFGSTPDVELLRADALRETGQPAQAEAAYRKLLGGEQAGAAWHGIGLLAGLRHAYGDAAQALKEAVRLEPTEALYLNDLGFALLWSGDVGGARVPIAQAAELAPTNRKVLGNLAVYLLVAGERGRAEKVMAEAQLPKTTRDAIVKLAGEIGRARTRAAAPAAAPAAALAPAMPARDDAAQLATARDAGRWDVPKTMLDRFAKAQ